MTAQASKSPQTVISLNELLNTANPRGRVLIDSEFVTISGHIKLFQLDINVKIDNVAIVGIDSGSPIFKKDLTRLHPSILEASSSSFGSDKKNCLNIKIPKPPKNPGIIRAWYVSIKFISRIKKKSGIMFT